MRLNKLLYYVNRKNFFTRIGGWSLFLIFLILLPVISNFNAYILRLIFRFLLCAALSLAWYMLSGITGRTILGSALYFGTSMYAAAILIESGVNIYVSIIAAGIMSAFMNIFVFSLLKLKGAYFVISTLFLAEGIKRLVLYFKGITGGAEGLYLYHAPSFSITYLYYGLFVVLSSTFIVLYLILNSKVGLALRAIRDDEDVTPLRGIYAMKYLILAILLGSFFMGLCGGIYTLNIMFIEPYHAFGMDWNVIPLISCVIGGKMHNFGPIVGSGIYVFLEEVIRSFIGFEYNLIVLGVLLVIILIFKPEGLLKIQTWVS